MFALACKTKDTAYFYLVYTFFRVSLPCSIKEIYYRTQEASHRPWTAVFGGPRGKVFTWTVLVSTNSLSTDAKALVDTSANSGLEGM